MGQEYYIPKMRPSGRDISESFGNDNGGAIPSNLLQIPNTESNSQYLKYFKDLGIKGHPARFPSKLPEFFIKFLTEEGDLVLDIFDGSNTTGWAPQQLDRRWLFFELDHQYLSASVLRESCPSSQSFNLLKMLYHCKSKLILSLKIDKSSPVG